MRAREKECSCVSVSVSLCARLCVFSLCSCACCEVRLCAVLFVCRGQERQTGVPKQIVSNADARDIFAEEERHGRVSCGLLGEVWGQACETQGLQAVHGGAGAGMPHRRDTAVPPAHAREEEGWKREGRPVYVCGCGGCGTCARRLASGLQPCSQGMARVRREFFPQQHVPGRR